MCFYETTHEYRSKFGILFSTITAALIAPRNYLQATVGPNPTYLLFSIYLYNIHVILVRLLIIILIFRIIDIYIYYRVGKIERDNIINCYIQPSTRPFLGLFLYTHL